MFALQVLGLLANLYSGSGVAATPVRLRDSANTHHAFDPALKDAPTVQVTVQAGNRSLAEATTTTVFSPEWEAEFRAGQEPGCGIARGSYDMRTYGLGSNINSESEMGGWYIVQGCDRSCVHSVLL